MSILKVEVGAPITLEVAKMEEVEGQFGPQLKFTAPSGDCVFVSKDAGYRQLERIGLTDDPTGSWLLFEKVQKGAKTFLNINPAPRTNGNGSGAKAGGGASPAPAPRTVSRPAVEQALDAEVVGYESPIYAAITRYVLNDIVPLYAQKGIPLTMEGIAAIANTQFIQASRNGH